MKKVNILLSTYNGERYIHDQLNSLLTQTYQNSIIYIRDDGSTDSTLSIIKEYIKKYRDRIVLIEAHERYGYPDCFWILLSQCDDADLYAFCDQDDVWKPEKVQNAVQALKYEIPMLYIHDYYICDRNLKRISLHRINKLDKVRGEQLIYYTIAQGFSMVINNSMRLLLLSENPLGKQLPHDGWCIWNAFYRGRLVYSPQPLAYYRRHDEAVTSSGMNTNKMILSWVKKEVFGDEMKLLHERADYFLICMNDSMDTREKEQWRLLAEKPRTPRSYIRRLFYPARLRPSFGGEIALRLLFLVWK